MGYFSVSLRPKYVDRNGLFLLYKGPLEEEEELRRWLMDEDVLKIPGQVQSCSRIQTFSLIGS